MTIIRAAHDLEHPYMKVSRATAQSKAFSYEALGLLTYLLSKPDDWSIGVDDLIRAGCGRDKVYRILKELAKAGYLVHVRSDAKQHLPPVWGERTVYERPFTEMPDTVSPNPESTDTVKSGNGAPNPEIPDTVFAVSGETALTNNENTDHRSESKEKEKENARAPARVPDRAFAMPANPTDRKQAGQQLLSSALQHSNGNAAPLSEAEFQANIQAMLTKYGGENPT